MLPSSSNAGRRTESIPPGLYSYPRRPLIRPDRSGRQPCPSERVEQGSGVDPELLSHLRQRRSLCVQPRCLRQLAPSENPVTSRYASLRESARECLPVDPELIGQQLDRLTELVTLDHLIDLRVGQLTLTLPRPGRPSG